MEGEKYKDSTIKLLAALAITLWVIFLTNFILTNIKSLHFNQAH